MSRRLDLVGIGLVVATVVWTLVSAAFAGGNPLPATGVILAAAAALAASRLPALAGVPAVPLAVAAVVGLLALVSIGDLARSVPGGSPLRYANANAALYAQGAVAAAMLAVWPPGRRLRVAGGALAVLFVGAVVLSRSAAAAALLALPAVALLVGLRKPRVAVLISTGAFVVAVAATTMLGAVGRERSPAWAREPLGGPRVDLWSDGLSLMAADPVVGVGPGRFRLESETAATSRSYAWAHNAWLHQGAETGVPGYALLVSIFLWGFARLWTKPAPDRVVAVAAGGLAMLGVHASVDYVLHFPLVVVAASALVGTGQASAPKRRAISADAAARQAIKAAILPFGIGGLREEGDVAILAYHRVAAGNGEISMPLDLFDAQMAELADSGEVIALGDVLDGGRGGVVLTVDDGYRDFHEHVLPVLDRYGLPLTLYLATGLVARRGRRDPDALTWEQLREAVSTGLVSVGSHTHSHVDLGTADERAARDELRRSRDLIEDRLGTVCRHFAYPFGVASPAAERQVRAMYDTAALAWGTNRAGRIDPHRLERTPILKSDARLFFRAKVRGMLDAEAAVYRMLRRGPWRHGAANGG